MRFERKLGVAQLLSLLALCFFVAVTRGSPSAFFDFTPRSVPFVPSVVQREEGRIDVSKRDVDCAFFPKLPSLLLLNVDPFNQYDARLLELSLVFHLVVYQLLLGPPPLDANWSLHFAIPTLPMPM